MDSDVDHARSGEGTHANGAPARAHLVDAWRSRPGPTSWFRARLGVEERVERRRTALFAPVR